MTSCFLRRCGLPAMIAAVCVVCPVQGQTVPEPPTLGNPRDTAAAREALTGWWKEALKTREERLEWWRDAQFGAFIHWGAYSDPAGVWNGERLGGYAEHLMHSKRIPVKEYAEKVVAPFNPEKYDAEAWAKLFKATGMKYVVITAKHHDGFAMWPSEVSKYNIRDATKFARDPMQELTDACRRNGLKFGFYYSHAMDWEHPDGPGNEWDYKNPGGRSEMYGKDWPNTHPEVVTRVRRYVDEKSIPQILELIEKYKPDLLWFDTSGKIPFADQADIVRAVREAAPDIIVNGRAARASNLNLGDYVNTGDNPAEVREAKGDWECIPTTNQSWGYHKLDHSHKPPEFFIRLLAKAAAKGGNMLMNVGPRGDGTIDPVDEKIFRGIGRWMDMNGESIYGTERTPLDRQAWGDSTRKGDTLYLHVFEWPSDGKLVVGGLESDPVSAYLLSDPDKAPLGVRRLSGSDVVVETLKTAPDAADSVIVLKFGDEIKARPGRLLASKGLANRLLAFDAEARGQVSYGDGKAHAYHATGLRDPSAALFWNVRSNEPTTFDVALKYSTKSADANPEYVVKLGEQSLEFAVKPTKDARDIQMVSLGKLKMDSAGTELSIQPAGAKGADAVQIYELVLTPPGVASAQGDKSAIKGHREVYAE